MRRDITVFMFFVVGSTAPAVRAVDPGLSEFYAASAWPALHRDQGNSDAVPFVAPTVARVKWTALDGAALLVAPTIGPEGNLYVATGRGPGTSHLHAFDRDGNLLWQSPPQQSLDDLDSLAVISAPAVDRNGDLYISDANQLWAFRANGSVKWVVPMPDLNKPFVSCVITPDGRVGGVTTAGKVFFVRRSDGASASSVLSLPGGPGVTPPRFPAGLWAGGLMDPAIIQDVFNGLFGYEAEVVNTPAVHPTTGRLYVTAAGPDRSVGVLYGIDLIGNDPVVAFQAPIGAGSGASPALSPDGRQVYAVGGDRVMVAVDAQTGGVLWTAGNAGSSASPAVGFDGTIYTGNQDSLSALNPADGSVRWQVSFNPLAEAYLPRRLPNDQFPSGVPVARVNSVVTVTPTHLLVGVILGYAFPLPELGTTPPQPQYILLCAIDPADGSIRGTTAVRDTSEAVISVGADGQLYFAHGAVTSSIAYYQINPLLPRRLRIPGPPPAGLSALEPLSYVDHAIAGVKWIQRLDESARNALASADSTSAIVALRRALLQLSAASQTVLRDTLVELEPATAVEVDGRLQTARTRLTAAVGLAVVGASQAIGAINLADNALAAALTMLEGRPDVTIEALPGVCPKEIGAKRSRDATLDVAVIGAPTFETWRLNLSSVALSRLDGVGGTVSPVRKLRGASSRSVDVVAPRSSAACGCEVTEPDGLVDRIFTFSLNDVIDVLLLDELPARTVVPLKLTGVLIDGTPFRAVDCVTVLRASRGR